MRIGGIRHIWRRRIPGIKRAGTRKKTVQILRRSSRHQIGTKLAICPIRCLWGWRRIFKCPSIKVIVPSTSSAPGILSTPPPRSPGFKAWPVISRRCFLTINVSMSESSRPQSLVASRRRRKSRRSNGSSGTSSRQPIPTTTPPF